MTSAMLSSPATVGVNFTSKVQFTPRSKLTYWNELPSMKVKSGPLTIAVRRAEG